MPSKRTPIHRPRHRLISLEAVRLFAEICTLHATYLACIRGQCARPGGREHCAGCRRYLDRGLELSRMLSLPPWQQLEHGYEPPPDLSGEELSEFWRAALRQAVASATSVHGMA